MLRYNMMTKLLRCVSSEIRNLPYYDGLTGVNKFLYAFEREALEDHHFQVQDLALCIMLAWWWGTHKDNFDEWHDYVRMMRLRFGRLKV